jgi:DNA-binding phage protein
MVSNTRPNGTSNAFDPVSMARILRDRQIAVSFVRKGETQNARAEIAKETGINLRTVYRAIDRQGKATRPTPILQHPRGQRERV